MRRAYEEKRTEKIVNAIEADTEDSGFRTSDGPEYRGKNNGNENAPVKFEFTLMQLHLRLEGFYPAGGSPTI